MASPTFTINASATTSSVSVTSGATVTATLASVTGVTSVAWVIIATDDTGTPGDAGTYGAASISGAVGETAEWTASTAGTAATIRCIINGGLGADGEPDTGMTAYGKWYVETAAGAEVCTSAEQEDDNRYSSSTHGICSPINHTVRNAHALPIYTVAGAPAAASYTGYQIYVSDEAGGAVPCFSDGTNWRRVTDRAIMS
jgi:hypothetical protein